MKRKLLTLSFLFLKNDQTFGYLLFACEKNTGAYNRTYSMALWQGKFYLPQQPSTPQYTSTSAMAARVDEVAEVDGVNPNPRVLRLSCLLRLVYFGLYDITIKIAKVEEPKQTYNVYPRLLLLAYFERRN